MGGVLFCSQPLAHLHRQIYVWSIHLPTLKGKKERGAVGRGKRQGGGEITKRHGQVLIFYGLDTKKGGGQGGNRV